MLAQRLLSRNSQFQLCSDCLSLTLKEQPIAKMIMKQEQVLCSSCANTSLHILPLSGISEEIENEPMLIRSKVYCQKHSGLRKCKTCSIYLKKDNYSECPYCGFSIFRKDMKKWKILFPFYKCELCQKQRCLRCQSSPSTLGSEISVLECENCEELKMCKTRQRKEFLKTLPTLIGIQFMFAVVCVTIFTPIQVLLNTTRKVKNKLWKQKYSKEPIGNILQIILVLLIFPLVWAIWLIITFLPQYWINLKANISVLYEQLLKKHIIYK